MNIKTTPFKEVFIIKPTLHLDERGSFMESFNEREVEKVLGKKTMFCQDNLTHSKKGVLRGLHYQLPPYSQTKLVSVIQGSVLDVIVDIRKGSPTFGHHFSCELSHENKLQLFVPRGFAHGFYVLEDETVFNYKCDNYYYKAAQKGIRYNDSDLAIDWCLDGKEVILSEKDKHLMTFKQFCQ